MNIYDIPDMRVYVPVTIAAGASGLSGPVDFGGLVMAGIVMPAVWVAASLSFQVSIDNATFQNLKSGTADVEINPAVSQGNSYWFGTNGTGQSGSDVHIWKAWRYWKFRSGTSATPVNQTGGAVITAVLMQMA